MATDSKDEAGPDFVEGVTLADFGGGAMLRGHVGDEAVLLSRVGDEIFATGASCTHYGGPLAEWILVGDTVHCPWHHACFSLRTGEALGAPAFDAIPCWDVERDGERIRVRKQAKPAPQSAMVGAGAPQDVVIVGGGAAGFACAEMLRRRGYRGRLTMLSADEDAPCDRPNLSKDFLAGEAPDEWMPLKGDDFYAEHKIELRLGAAVRAIDTAARQVELADGGRLPFDRLLIATGAAPIRLPIAGADQPHVFTLRSFADSRAIAGRAAQAKVAVVLGSGFIGLEVAASLRHRGLEVHVVSLDERPLERVLGRALGDFLRALHEEHGVHFHMKSSIASIGAKSVTLSDGRELAADLVVLGIGVRPETALAEAAGLAVDRGILVDQHLETAVPGIYAAGDVARWRDAGGGQSRVEHWVVAERQGQVAAGNMLGGRQAFRDVPFFWSAHYDVSIRYVGHAEGFDEVEVLGSIEKRDCEVRYRKGGRLLAVAAIGRDAAALRQGEALAPA